jgi:hypothetical protein
MSYYERHKEERLQYQRQYNAEHRRNYLEYQKVYNDNVLRNRRGYNKRDVNEEPKPITVEPEIVKPIIETKPSISNKELSVPSSFMVTFH